MSKKIFSFVLMIILSLLIQANAFAQQPADEQATFVNVPPDALILLDLSGSMAWNPAGDTRIYGASSCAPDTVKCAGVPDPNYPYGNSTCTADTVNCAGSGNPYYTYGSDVSCVADDNPGKCQGAPSGYPYSANSSCTADSSAGKCVGAPNPSYTYARSSACTANTTYCNKSDCSGGFCATSHSGCSVKCAECSGGFCKTSKTGCNINCNYQCSGGFCHTAKTGCDVSCSACKDGFCKTANAGCNTYCGNCSNGYCNTNAQADCSTDCSRVSIAKRTIFSVFDDDNNGVINSSDKDSLNIRIGFMRYKNGNDTSGDPNSGNIYVVRGLGTNPNIGVPYYQTYCGATGASGSCAINSSCIAGECVVNESPGGGTPLASALLEAKTYLNNHKTADDYKNCRQKFIILITDGSDTYACGAGGGECDSNSFRRRRASVAAAKALNDAGYKVFVIGFGASMPDYLENTLNWMAYYGGTKNTLTTQSVPSPLYDTSLYADVAAACSSSASSFQSGICQGSTYSQWYADPNDPGYMSVSGYAYITADSDNLMKALQNVFSSIREASYTFSQASVQAVRTIDENYLYEASFEPVTNEPLWTGHIRRYTIDEWGKVATSSTLDAGAKLKDMPAADRVIYTLKNGVITPFLNTDGSLACNDASLNITCDDLAVTTTSERNMIVDFMRSGELDEASTRYGWKLGDIFHNSPLLIGSPNEFYIDNVQLKSNYGTCPGSLIYKCTAYDIYRLNHQRTSANGYKLLLAGANDGQLHLFKTGPGSAALQEHWSFIPPNLLPKLKNLAHDEHPALLSHQYLVDGAITASEVWLGSGDGTTKSSSDWHTMMVLSEGRGGSTTLWSLSNTCTPTIDANSGFNSRYTSTYPNYCGYYAFDLTDTSLNSQSDINNAFKWRLGSNTALTANVASHLGQPWSKLTMGRLKIAGAEKWVGFVSGGYSGVNTVGCSSGCDTRGKGFFVVDLANGNVLWSYTRNNDNSNMNFDLVGSPAVADLDSDGFVDTAYIGDTGGNVWRFKFCSSSDSSSCGTGSWTSRAKLFFNTTGSNRPIYSIPSVTLDTDRKIWVYFGTGNITDPTDLPDSTNPWQDKLFAVRDEQVNATDAAVLMSDLKDITTSTYDPNNSTDKAKPGWYILLGGSGSPGPGEKMLAESKVYAGTVYFTTFTPSTTTDPCNQDGTATLYGINYITGAGQIGGATNATVRSTNIGSGIPSAPIISINPYTGKADVYASSSAGSATESHTKKQDAGDDFGDESNPPGPRDKVNRTNFLIWRDMRVQ